VLDFIEKYTSFSPDQSNETMECWELFQDAIGLFQLSSHVHVIIAFRWEKGIHLRISDNSSRLVEDDNFYNDFIESFSQFLSAFLSAETANAIYVIGNLPGAANAGRDMSGGLSRCGAYFYADCPVSFPRIEGEGQKLNNLLENHFQSVNGVNFIDPYEFLCDLDRCFLSDQGMPIYYDHSHLTNYGLQKLLQEGLAESLSSKP